MNVIVIYLFCAIGVAISILLPVLKQALPTPKGGQPSGVHAIGPRIWKVAKPYLVTGFYSLLVSLLIVAFLQDQLSDWASAVLAGYAADSTLQKLTG